MGETSSRLTVPRVLVVALLAAPLVSCRDEATPPPPVDCGTSDAGCGTQSPDAMDATDGPPLPIDRPDHDVPPFD